MTGRLPDSHPTGILGLPDRLPFRVERTPPPAGLAWWVDWFWTSSWDFPPGRGATARVLPHPCVNLTLERGDLVVTGVAGGVFSRRLAGTDEVFGVKFRCAAFRPFIDRPAAGLSGSGQPADGLLSDAAALRSALAAATGTPARIAVFGDWVEAQGAHTDDSVERAAAVVSALVGDPEVRRVAEVCTKFGVSERALQRLFADHVGVTPRWVLRRGRLHAAADRVIELAMAGRPGGWADVAADLGYVDQAHFSRDFRAVLGVPPGRWAAALLTVD